MSAADRAEAWDEGYIAGHECALPSEKAKTWNFHSCRIENPYRAAGRAETTTATVEDAYRLAYDVMREHPGIWFDSLRAAIEALADADLLATARTVETTTATSEAVVKVLNEHPDMTDRSAYDGCGCGDPGGNEHVARELDRRGLLATAPTPTTEDMATRLAAAEAELDRLCDGGRFTMSIPAREGHDSDLLIQAALSDLRGLLATAPTRPTREQIAKALAKGYETDQPEPNRHDYRAADAVLALLADQPDPADIWDQAVETIREQHPACEDPCEMCAEMDDWLTALADNPYRGGTRP